MSPVQHPVSGPVLTFQLEDELRILREQLATGSRTARTLVKNGPLRATLIGLAPGGSMATHTADGPITVHVLEGTIAFETEGKSWELPAGSLLALDRAIAHTVHAPRGGVFLLTVSFAAE